MRPSKSRLDLTVQSLKKKKYKANKLAAGCYCEVIRKEAEMLGWELECLMVETISAMQEMKRGEST
jgi:predicted hydrolase (HD superfamily)